MKQFHAYLFVFFLLVIFAWTNAPAQETQFGQNKVQYKTFDWYYIQSSHFDVYFSAGGEYLANFTADAAESAYVLISKSFRYQLTNRVPIIVYNSHNDFQQSNVVNEYLEEGIGGLTELFKNRVILPFEGDYKKFRHVIHHELVHAVVNDMFYGGSIQSIITNNITLQLPLWFNEGLAEYESLKWDTDSDMFLRDATVHEYLPPIQNLYGYFAYRGGQSVWNYIATKYGDQKIGDILSRIRGTRSVDQGFRAAIGLSVEELSERWQKEQKVLYWPDIAKRQEPTDYAKRLTNHMKDGGFYNTSPSISPQGDRIAFISNRDDYFDVFIMNATDGSIQNKLINGQRTADFEELHLLTPGMSWSPDGRRLALATKTGERDAIFIVDVNSGHEQKIELDLDGIFSVAWNPDSLHANDVLAFVGMLNGRSDIYTYDLDTKQLINLTDDVFSDADPSWSSDGKSIYFASDRSSYIDPSVVPADFKMQKYNFRQLDIFKIDIATKKIARITDFPNSDETSPVAAPDGKHLLFISDMNGINNIYIDDLDSNKIYPQTNSLSGVYQLSLSRDGSKLAFNSLNNSGFDLFLMRNPLDRDGKPDTLEPTEYFKRMYTVRKTDTAGGKKDGVQVSNDVIIKTTKVDSESIYSTDAKIDLRNYVFNDAFRNHPETKTDTMKSISVANNLDESGNYKVIKYKLNFSPDIVYGNAGFNTFYGVQGTTEMAFSDMMGNHQIYLLTNLMFDLKNSDFALAYFYLPKRMDLGIQAFHSARFLYLGDLSGDSDSLYRFGTYGVTAIGLYPIDKFNRFDFSLSWYDITKDNLDDAFTPTEERELLVPSVSYVHDNTLWGITAPANGDRYNLTLMASPKFGSQSLGFYSLTLDYRDYLRLWRNYTFVLRLAGGGSFGEDPQRFVIGGVDNWINRQFENNRIPIDKPEDIMFLTSGIPLRGYDYGARMGTKYGLVNMEFRFPFFGYFAAGPLPIFFQSLSGEIFLDMGSTWTLGRYEKLFDRDENGSVYMRDLLAGTGYGIRMAVLGFLLKLDVAWSFDLQQTSTPQYYLSLGEDI